MSLLNRKNLLMSKSDVQGIKGASSLNRMVAIAIVSAVLAGGLVGYFWYSTNWYSEPVLTNEERLTPTPYGTLMFTAVVDNKLDIYALNLNRVEESIIKFDTPSPIASTEFTDKFNPTRLYFSASTIYTTEETDQLGLHSWDLSSKTFRYHKNAGGNLERDINFSQPTGMIAFSRLSESVESVTGPNQIDDYEIVIFDPAQDMVVEILADGIYPRWSPTGETLLYVTKDGLHTFDLNKKEVTKVIGPNELGVEITPSTALDVSMDGKYIIITSQGSGSITTFNVSSWSPLTFWESGTIKDPSRFYFNPVISPDGTLYAVVATDKFNNNFINPRLEIRTIQGNNVLFSRSLNDFDPEKFFIDDWVVGEIIFSEDIAI